MSLVRFTEYPGKGCKAIVNEVAVKERLFCWMKSIHKDRGKVQYCLCEDCYRQSEFPDEIQTK